jgi:crotonobetainyl-CoA:carnitine CoA-transferase CaiB-like acyl-CoA transferase
VEGEFRALGFPVKMSATPQEIRLPPPLLNEHGLQIRQELVAKGYLSESAIEDATS